MSIKPNILPKVSIIWAWRKCSSQLWINVCASFKDLYTVYPISLSASPCYPAQTYGRDRRYWRKYIQFDFNQLIKLATQEIIRFKWATKCAHVHRSAHMHLLAHSYSWGYFCFLYHCNIMLFHHVELFNLCSFLQCIVFYIYIVYIHFFSLYIVINK